MCVEALFKSYSETTTRSKKTTKPPGYFASDESMLIPSDISDTCDWEWIAGGFRCRDVARERFISDSIKTSNQEHTRSFCEPNNNIIFEILEDITNPENDQQTQCPISIIPAETDPVPQGRESSTSAEAATIAKVLDSQNSSTAPMEEDATANFAVYEIVDSSDETAPATGLQTNPGNVSPIIGRSSRNVGPPKFYGKRFFIDVVDLAQSSSGSASNPIILENGHSDKWDHINSETPLEIVTIDSESSTPEQISSSSTDESLRMATDNFEEQSELDSELFNLELENFSNCCRKCK